jgi:dipeptidase E
MKTIVAIGGGETFDDNTIINKRIVELSKKSEPNLLFLPTASGDSSEYFDQLNVHFSQLGCNCDVLYLISEKPTKETIAEKISNSDIIYVGGGNTFRMMKVWKKTGVDVLLREAYEQGKVLCGISAGSICWFKYGNSDSRKFNNPEAGLIKVTGLNLIQALHCPHYDSEADRKPDLKKMMRKTYGVVAIALEDCCAIETLDDQYRVISARENARAYKVYWRGGVFFEEVIEQTENYQPLNELVSKKEKR